ncbi:hypothetical protein ES703_64022 [subsurface metagenome]
MWELVEITPENFKSVVMVFPNAMKNITKIYRKIKAQLDHKEKHRQKALSMSRSIIRHSGGLISAVHRSEDPEELLKGVKALQRDVDRLKTMLKKHPDLYYSNIVESAEQEFCEAYIVLSILTTGSLPEPDELKTTYTAYIMGLSDAIGEFRRCALDTLKTRNITKANDFLKVMEDLYNILIGLDYPAGLIAIRRKQDIARGVIEKTRSEIAIIGSNEELRNTIKEFQDSVISRE